MVFRPEEELSDPACIESFRLVPFVNEHPAGILGDESQPIPAVPAERHGVQGTIGEQVYFDYPYLRGNFKIFSSAAMRAVDAGKIELSPGYRCRYDWTPGEWQGQPYDAVQRCIRGNHLALVDEGRTGPDVAVLDHFTITLDAKELPAMADENTPPAGGGEPDQIASAKALIEQLKPMIEGTAEIKQMLTQLLGMEQQEQQNQPPAQTEDAPPAAPAAPAAGTAMDAALSGKLDALMKRLDKLETRPALDSALVAGLAERDALAGKVQAFVGTFDSRAMTAQQVAVYAVEKLGIPAVAGQEVSAVNAWMHGRTPAAQSETKVVAVGDGKTKTGDELFDPMSAWGAK